MKTKKYKNASDKERKKERKEYYNGGKNNIL